MYTNYKLSIGIAALVLLLPFVTHAAYNDVVMTSNSVIKVGSISLNVSGTTNVVASLVVSSSNFVASMSGGSTITVVSTDKYTLTSDAASSEVSSDCNSTYSLLKISIPNGGTLQNVTVTPSTTACTPASTSGSRPSGGGGGGGGGGGSYIPPVVTVTPVVTPSPTSAPSVSVDASIQSVWTRDLSRGSIGSDVMALQSFLATDKKIYPEGQLTGSFGPATLRAVKKFQAKYGLPQTGTVGPATRAKLAEVYLGGPKAPIGTPTSQMTATSVGSTGGAFSRSLSKGSSGADVKALQVLLNSDPDTQVAATGSGSPGNENENFGSLTAAAVGKFQVKYGLSAPGQPGYGIVGPKTRAQLNQLVK